MTPTQERLMLTLWLTLSILGLALPVWLIWRGVRGLREVVG